MLRYLWKAFNVRPFGMPVPPLWFAVIASGLVGYFLAAPLAMIGLGATAMFTGVLASSKRFRTAVDALLQDPLLILQRLAEIIVEPIGAEALLHLRDLIGERGLALVVAILGHRNSRTARRQ